MRFGVFERALYIVILPNVNLATTVPAFKIGATAGAHRVAVGAIIEFVHWRICARRDREESRDCAANPGNE